MTQITYTEMKKNIDSVLQKLEDDRAPITVTRKGKPFVIMTAEDYDSLSETLHLLRSPENAKRLREAEQDFQDGKKNYHERTLIEE